jgi:hypothetical protein
MRRSRIILKAASSLLARQSGKQKQHVGAANNESLTSFGFSIANEIADYQM